MHLLFVKKQNKTDFNMTKKLMLKEKKKINSFTFDCSKSPLLKTHLKMLNKDLLAKKKLFKNDPHFVFVYMKLLVYRLQVCMSAVAT